MSIKAEASRRQMAKKKQKKKRKKNMKNPPTRYKNKMANCCKVIRVLRVGTFEMGSGERGGDRVGVAAVGQPRGLTALQTACHHYNRN